MIEQSMTQFLTEHPGTKYVFFGGKGGVGKTVMAGAAALWFAQQGRRTLLASTNPVHSLTSMLGQDVFGRHTPVEGVPDLVAYEIDTKDTIEKSKIEIREKIEWFLKYADIKTKADEFVESATMNPAFEESAMFENMIDLMFEDEYEVYVFDTAPTANARRLLGMSESAASSTGSASSAFPWAVLWSTCSSPKKRSATTHPISSRTASSCRMSTWKRSGVSSPMCAPWSLSLRPKCRA